MSGQNGRRDGRMVAGNEKIEEGHRYSWLRPTLVPALVALIVLVAGGIFLDLQSSTINRARAEAHVLTELAVIRAKLEGNINSSLQLVRGLVSVVATTPDLTQAEFDALAGNLLEAQSQLRSIAIAPDMIVTMSYPLVGNESAIGLNYRLNAAQRSSAMLARDTGQLVLAGPVDLVQGGRGFIGRFPVLVDSAQGRQFWGLVSAVIDVDRLYADSGLTDPTLGIELSLSGKDAVEQSLAPFFGPDLSAQAPVSAEITMPYGAWTISAVPKGGWSTVSDQNWLMRLAIVVAGILILVPIVITGHLVGERKLHFLALKSRESELSRMSRRLEVALNVSKVGVWELDMASGCETWDARTNELYGRSADGGPRSHQDWKGAVHPDDQNRAEEEFQRMIGADGHHYEGYYRVLLPDGGLRHVRSVATLHRDPGSPDKVIGANWDVTTDIELNRELQHATERALAHNAELESARIRIEHNALHDSLTGLPNRRYVDEKLEGLAAEGFGPDQSIALLHIDLDRFKQINDTLGHAAGDAMLVHASAVLRAKCRDGDFVARIGGDEFVVLTTANDSQAELAALADAIVRQMRQPVTYEGHECRFGVSIGIASACGRALDGRQLLINADIALYRAKGRGRNCLEFFSTALQAEVINPKRVADEILSGLERDEFIAYYQPQFDARTLDVVGVEALARWRHPDGRIMTPDSFLPVAEELNVMAMIDRLMLEQSLAALDRWEAMGLIVPRASVNVSLRRLHDEELITSLRQLDIRPGRISFELVESVYLDDNDDIVSWNIDQIKELGIDVEIDDFGTGYASIVSLQKLRPTRLKIDRQLVMPILKDMPQRQLLTSIIDIGKSMGIEVVAEDVETMEHAAILRDLGCDILQGYAFAKPLCAPDLERFLTEQPWRLAS